MPQSYCRAFYHFVWATWDREPLLIGPVEQNAYALILAKCKEMGCKVIKIGGIADHVHLLVSIPSTICVADFMESIKGCSSRGMNDAYENETLTFRWQAGYGMLTVSPGDVSRVALYIEKQKEHHASSKLWGAAEITGERDLQQKSPPDS